MDLWARVSPPRFADDERTSITPTLYLISLGLMVMGTVSLVESWTQGWTGAAWTLAVENLCLIAALWLTHRGKLQWATKIICFSELACGLLLIGLFGAGFKDTGMQLFPLILVIAALLLEWRSYVQFALLVLVSVTCAGILLSAAGTATRSYTVVNVVNILLITAVTVGLLARSLRGSLFKSRESERRFRELFENVHLVAVMFDSQGVVTFCNEYFLSITGWTRDEVIGHKVYEFIAVDHRARVAEAIESALATGRMVAFLENAILTKVGKLRWLQWNNATLRNAQGRIIGFASLGVDVTEHRALQEQYQQAQKLESIGRLAGGVAHDFNNLLTVISGYAELAMRQLSEDSPLQDWIAEITQAADRAAALIRQLLAFSRKQVIEPKVLDLNRVIHDLSGLLRRLVGEDIDVSTILESTGGRVLADDGQLQQVLMNLAVNARDAMPGGGKLTITTSDVEIDDSYVASHPGSQSGAHILLAVTDTGVGMDEETQLRIFEPFFTTKAQGEGTGLGLSMVYGIVGQSGGWIQVSSEVGKGTTFGIYLPRIAGEVEVRKARQIAVEVFRGNETVLVVEDQFEVRKLASDVLRSYGYRVLEAANGSEALSLCGRFSEPVHLMIADVVMPGMTGPELADQLASLRPEMKVLYMSGYTSSTIAQYRTLHPDVAYLSKPFSPNVLAKKVRETLGEPPLSATILVVDDYREIRELVAAFLRASGYNVLVAANGIDAMEILGGCDADLVITDLVMPEREGLETIREILRKRPSQKIIAMSGAFGGQYLHVAQLLGVRATLAKPIGPDQLLKTVRETLAT